MLLVLFSAFQKKVKKIFRFQIPQFSYLIAIAFLLFLSIPGVVTLNWYHMSSVLGPVIQDMHGQAVLIHVDSQYGLADVWFLSFLFKLWGGISLYKAYVVDFLMCFGVFLLIPVLVKQFTGRWSASVLALSFAVGFGAVPFQSQIYSLFSFGAWRFGFFFLLLLTVAMRRVLPQQRGLASVLECLFVGIASIWSMETATFTLFPYILLLIYEKRLLKSLPKMVLSILVFWSFAQFRIWHLSGQLADVRRFWEYVSINVSEGASSRSFKDEPYGTWVMMWLLLSGSVTVTYLSFIKKRMDSVLLLSTATFYVIISYFVNRSIDAIFCSLAPSIAILAVYWIYKLFPDRHMASILIYVASVFTFYLNGGVDWNTSSVWEAGRGNSINLVANLMAAAKTKSFAAFIKDDPCLQFSKETTLIQKLSQADQPLFLLAGANNYVLDFMSSVCLGRQNAFNLNPACVTYINGRASKEKIQDIAKKRFEKGQVVFVDTSFTDNPSAIPGGWTPYEIFKKIQKNYKVVRLGSAGQLHAFEIL
jgi:hypothetical protein